MSGTVCCDSACGPLTDVRHMVFSGGAMNGLAYVGALQLLEAVFPPLLERVEGYAGASIGALVSLLLCIGYTSAGMRAVIDTFNTAVLFPPRTRVCVAAPVGMLDAMTSLGGWVGDLISRYMGKPDVNFAELYRRTRRDLVVTVTNLSARRVEYWGRHTKPGMLVCTAVVASMALPLVFTPVEHAGQLFVDGGLGDNFPVGVFPHATTLALRIKLDPQPPWNNPIEYGMALLEIKSELDRNGAPGPLPPRTVTIPGSALTGLNIFLSALHRDAIVNAGARCMLLWLLRVPLLLFVWCRATGMSWSALAQGTCSKSMIAGPS